jgi:glucose-1-phosphate cytidylyltransferase
MGEESHGRPKPMAQIGGRPMLWHILQRFSLFGHGEFVVALGHQSHVIKDYFVHYHLHHSSLTVDLRDGSVIVEDEQPAWRVRLVETGLDTQTGGRLKRVAPWLRKGEVFFLAYADCLSDVDLDQMLRFHRSHGRLGTMMVVAVPERYGRVTWEGDRVAGFSEKPAGGDGWINGGCFVLDPRVLEYVDGDCCAWEREPLERLAAEGELMGYLHEGFWAGVDTPAERAALDALCTEGRAPWLPQRTYAAAADRR